MFKICFYYIDLKMIFFILMNAKHFLGIFSSFAVNFVKTLSWHHITLFERLLFSIPKYVLTKLSMATIIFES